jgi:ferredoxin
MKLIVIDADLCQGSRQCAAIAPQAVGFGPDGVAVPTGMTLDDQVADRLAATCPAMAITAVNA